MDISAAAHRIGLLPWKGDPALMPSAVVTNWLVLQTLLRQFHASSGIVIVAALCTCICVRS